MSKGNVLSVSESLAHAFTMPGLTDSPSISETLALSVSITASDSATISESINVVFISGASSVLNVSGLNTSVLN